MELHVNVVHVFVTIPLWVFLLNTVYSLLKTTHLYNHSVFDPWYRDRILAHSQIYVKRIDKVELVANISGL